MRSAAAWVSPTTTPAPSTWKCSPRALPPSTPSKPPKPRSPASIPNPFTQAELKRAKDDLLNSFLFRYDTREKILDERERLEFYSYPADYLETYRAAIEKVTLADVTAAAKKYIHPDKLAILVVGNGPQIKPGLDALDLGAPTPIDITIPKPAGAPIAGSDAGTAK